MFYEIQFHTFEIQFNSINALAMKKLLYITLFSLATLIFSIQSFGQMTYISNGSYSSSDSNYFTKSTCWTPTGTCNSSLIPVFTGSTSCKITIIINHSIDYAGDLNLGGNIEIQVNTGGELNLNGSIIISNETRENFIKVTGGSINVSGGLTLESGKNNSSGKTELEIDIRNGGSFNINGGLLDIQNDANLKITGDKDAESALFVKSFDFGQRSKIDIMEGGGLIVDGLTDYIGNNSSINVYGFFRTGGVLIRGGAGNQLNTFGNAEVIVENDLDVRGNSDITFGGTSEVDIGGNIRIEGGSKVTATDTAKVFVCGSYPDPSTSNSSIELIDGQFSPNCRILPVDLLNLSARFERSSISSLIEWSTAKETANSHFEIERSDKGISDFKKVGEIDGMGWKDTLTEYKFVDDKLPLSGGNILYRIKQVDFDGDFTYSKVHSVRVEGVQATQGVWRAFPNPTLGDQLRISLLDRSQYEEEQITFRIVHPNLITQGITVNSEDEMNDQLAQLIPRAPKGVLVVEIQWGQKVEHIKVLKK